LPDRCGYIRLGKRERLTQPPFRPRRARELAGHGVVRWEGIGGQSHVVMDNFGNKLTRYDQTKYLYLCGAAA
jgi:hypothetical protein